MQIYFFYDIFTVLIILGLVLLGYRKGFTYCFIKNVAAVLGVAFTFVLYIPISNFIYSEFAEIPARKIVSEKTNEMSNETKNAILNLYRLNGENIVLDGKNVLDYTPIFDENNLSYIPLKNVNLSETGITEESAKVFGFVSDNANSNSLDSLNFGTSVVKKEKLNDYSIGDIILSEIIASRLTSAAGGKDYSALKRISETANKFKLTGQISENTVAEVILPFISVKDSPDYTESVNERITNAIMKFVVRPAALSFIRPLTFPIFFVIISVLSGIILTISKKFNKISLIGFADKFFGGILGAASGMIIVFALCFVVKLIVMSMHGRAFFFNETDIYSSTLFSKFYSLLQAGS